MNLRLRSELPLLEIQLFLTLQTSHLIHSTDLRSNHDLVGNMLDRLPGLKLLVSFGFSSCFNTLAFSLDICKRTKSVLKYFIRKEEIQDLFCCHQRTHPSEISPKQNSRVAQQSFSSANSCYYKGLFQHIPQYLLKIKGQYIHDCRIRHA